MYLECHSTTKTSYILWPLHQFEPRDCKPTSTLVRSYSNQRSRQTSMLSCACTLAGIETRLLALLRLSNRDSQTHSHRTAPSRCSAVVTAPARSHVTSLTSTKYRGCRCRFTFVKPVSVNGTTRAASASVPSKLIETTSTCQTMSWTFNS